MLSRPIELVLRESAMSKSVLVGVCSIVACLATLAGCGGAGGGASAVNPALVSSRGAVQLSIQWSPPNLAATAVQNSVRVSLETPDGQNSEQVVSRPAGGQTGSAASFSNISPGAVTLTAAGYASIDGSGAVLSSGSRDVMVTTGQTTQTGILQSGSISSYRYLRLRRILRSVPTRL